MDPTRFDRLAITVGQRTTRRSALGLLTALGLTGLPTEEASAASCLATGAPCGGRSGTCCSGICKGQKKRCRCPQRVCCQCGGLTVPCGFVSGLSECSKRCAKLGGGGAQTVNPQKGVTTTVCNGNQCSQVSCVP
jgi:hypothetical protein